MKQLVADAVEEVGSLSRRKETETRQTIVSSIRWKREKNKRQYWEEKIQRKKRRNKYVWLWTVNVFYKQIKLKPIKEKPI